MADKKCILPIKTTWDTPGWQAIFADKELLSFTDDFEPSILKGRTIEKILIPFDTYDEENQEPVYKPQIRTITDKTLIQKMVSALLNSNPGRYPSFCMGINPILLITQSGEAICVQHCFHEDIRFMHGEKWMSNEVYDVYEEMMELSRPVIYFDNPSPASTIDIKPPSAKKIWSLIQKDVEVSEEEAKAMQGSGGSGVESPSPQPATHMRRPELKVMRWNFNGTPDDLKGKDVIFIGLTLASREEGDNIERWLLLKRILDKTVIDKITHPLQNAHTPPEPLSCPTPWGMILVFSDFTGVRIPYHVHRQEGMVHGDNWVSSELYDVFKKMFGVTGLPHIILLGLNWGGSTLACRDCQDLIDDLFPEYKGISFPPYAEWTLPKRYIIRKQKAIMDEEEFGASKIHWLENVELEYLRRKNVVSIAFKLIPLKGDYWTGGGIYKVLKDPVMIDRIVQALLKADPHDHDRITDSCLGIVMLLAFEDNTGIVTAFTPFLEQFVNVAVVSKRTYGAVRVSEELFDIYETLFGSLKDRGTPGPYTEEARQKWLEKQARKKQEEI